MATWAPPSNATLATGKPLTQDKIRAIRDLPSALAERAATSPWVNEYGAREYFPRFLTSGSAPVLVDQWVVPDDVYRAVAIIIGGGGMGGSVTTSPVSNAGSGGGAGAVTIVRLELTPGEVWSVITGAGGSDPADPTINQAIDSYETGDGGRTTFGIYTAAGGKVGKDLNATGINHFGAGGNTTSEGGVPTIRGGPGKPVFFNTFGFGGGYYTYSSGAGGQSYLGPGAPQVGDGDGNTPVQIVTIDSKTRRIAIPGAGGSGAATSSSTAQVGGDGAHGAVLLRY